jgi:hypothetical protein
MNEDEIGSACNTQGNKKLIIFILDNGVDKNT